MSRIFHLVIVGGGASGSIALIRILETLKENVKLTLIDPHPLLGVGRAYSTQDENHLLNVAHGQMSIYSEHPADFTSWLSQNGKLPNSEHHPFVARKYFGQYLLSKLNSLPKNRYHHIQERVSSIQRLGKQWKIMTSSGPLRPADGVIIATGFRENLNPALLKCDDAFLQLH